MELLEANHNVGLVLEGGGMRGLFTAGVIDVLMEQGITFPCAVGVSAGACFGVNIKSLQIGRALRYNLQMMGNPQYMGLRSYLRTGDYVSAEYAYHTVPMQIDIFDRETYARHPMQFHLVCTDVDTGEPVYRNIDHIDYNELEWIRASASLPMVSNPVCLDGRRLMDGGLSDSIPLKYMEQQGYERNLVVLTQPLGYRKPAVAHPWVYKLLCRKYPRMVEALVNRPERYNAQLEYVEQQAAAGRTFLIAPPSKLAIGRIEQNADKLKCCYELGRQACEAQLPQLLDFLGKD